MINEQILQGQWNEIRGTLQEHWGILTNDDLRRFDGNLDKLVGLIQRKTGESRKAVQRYLEEVTADASSAISSAAETARGYASRATETAQDALGRVTNQMRERYGDAEDIVRSSPAESVAVAFGAGLFVGLIAGLVMRSR
jgi:uncharacterized protein YjbJ (UPF0337 family)